MEGGKKSKEMNEGGVKEKEEEDVKDGKRDGEKRLSCEKNRRRR
jgi:hypothetical protein